MVKVELQAVLGGTAGSCGRGDGAPGQSLQAGWGQQRGLCWFCAHPAASWELLGSA